MRILAQRVLRLHGKDAFIAHLPSFAKVLDIGCGNRSPQRTKELRSDLYYVGLDVGDYFQSVTSLKYADEYRTTSSEKFVSEIVKEDSKFNAIISSHNLEHCSDQYGVLRAMAGALRSGGKMYLAFPCEESVGFPSRAGTLRFSDDPSHQLPPVWQDTIGHLSHFGMRVIFARKRYRPMLPFLLGMALEPVAALFRAVMPLGLTWAFWGFESVIWAEKN